MPIRATMGVRLAAFITSNLDAILLDWVAFAKNQLPAAREMDEAALLDHGKTLLEEIVTKLARPEGDRETKAKSQGNSKNASISASVPSRSHARQRERQGFEVGQMIAEYRTLRATVLRQWQASSNDAQAQE